MYTCAGLVCVCETIALKREKHHFSHNIRELNIRVMRGSLNFFFFLFRILCRPKTRAQKCVLCGRQARERCIFISAANYYRVNGDLLKLKQSKEEEGKCYFFFFFFFLHDNIPKSQWLFKMQKKKIDKRDCDER